jgi:hypothetical protein
MTLKAPATSSPIATEMIVRARAANIRPKMLVRGISRTRIVCSRTGAGRLPNGRRPETADAAAARRGEGAGARPRRDPSGRIEVLMAGAGSPQGDPGDPGGGGPLTWGAPRKHLLAWHSGSGLLQASDPHRKQNRVHDRADRTRPRPGRSGDGS